MNQPAAIAMHSCNRSMFTVVYVTLVTLDHVMQQLEAARINSPNRKQQQQQQQHYPCRPALIRCSSRMRHAIVQLHIDGWMDPLHFSRGNGFIQQRSALLAGSR